MEQGQITFSIDEVLRSNFLKAIALEQRSSDDVLAELVRAYVNGCLEQAVPINKVTISAAERQRREKAVCFSRTSLGLEGIQPSAEEEAHARLFINGDIDLDDYVQLKSVAANEER